MADLFGLDNMSYLSSPQQDTAKTIRDAFASSMAQRDRYLQRYPGLLPPSAAMASSFINDEALKRAQVTAGTINNNQQLQNVIDASHATPHGVVQNLSAYLPSVAAALRAFPALFGQQAAAELGRKGAVGYGVDAVKKVVHWFKGPDGATYGLDESGKVIAQYPAGYSQYPDLGISDKNTNFTPTTGAMPNYTQDMWPTTLPQQQNFGETQWPDTGFDTESFDIPYGT